jgi:hypothetical protein
LVADPLVIARSARGIRLAALGAVGRSSLAVAFALCLVTPAVAGEAAPAVVGQVAPAVVGQVAPRVPLSRRLGAVAQRQWQKLQRTVRSPKRLTRLVATNTVGLGAGVLVQALTGNYMASAFAAYAASYAANWSADCLAPSTADRREPKSVRRHLFELTAGSTVAAATTAIGMPYATHLIESSRQQLFAAPFMAAVARLFGTQSLVSAMATTAVSMLSVGTTAGTQAATREAAKLME